MTSTEYAENCTIIYFRVNLWRTPTQTRSMLESAKIKSSGSKALVFKCHERFKDGPDSMEDDKGCGRKLMMSATSNR